MITFLSIRFCRGRGFDSRLIEWYSRCQWSHVELLFGEDTFGAQFYGGVKWRTIHDKCYKDVAECQVWEIPITQDEYEQLLRLIGRVKLSPYDWRAIVSFMLGPWRWHHTDAFICSGVITYFLMTLRKIVTVFPFENYDPADVYMLVPNIPGARQVYDAQGASQP